MIQFNWPLIAICTFFNSIAWWLAWKIYNSPLTRWVIQSVLS